MNILKFLLIYCDPRLKIGKKVAHIGKKIIDPWPKA